MEEVGVTSSFFEDPTKLVQPILIINHIFDPSFS